MTPNQNVQSNQMNSLNKYYYSVIKNIIETKTFCCIADENKNFPMEQILDFVIWICCEQIILLEQILEFVQLDPIALLE